MDVSCLSKGKVVAAIERMAHDVEGNRDYLTELDSAIGDADHGINMSRGFAALRAKLPSVCDKCIGTILKTVGMTLVSTVGGASGPLYGTAFMYGGNALVGEECLTLEGVRKCAKAACDGVAKRGGAVPDDKTMLDAMIPVANYLLSQQAGSDLETGGWAGVWRSAADAAKDGMESTVPLIARKGRASFLGERSIGHIDPGAASFYLMMESIAQLALEEGEQ